MKLIKSLFAASAAVLLPLGAFAIPTIKMPIATVSTDSTTLTFTTAPVSSVPVGVKASYLMTKGDFARDDAGFPNWYDYSDSITTVVFTDAFCTSAVPTNCQLWFAGLKNLTTITGLAGLNTSAVTNMCSMFDSCEALTELDLSGFDTSKVVDMQCMFFNCSNLQKIYVSKGFSTDSLVEGYEMFGGSPLIVGGQGTTYDDDCLDGEYARIDNRKSGEPGYFSAVPVAVLSSDGKALSFYADGANHESEGTVYSVLAVSNQDPQDNPPWYEAHETITAVNIDASFATYQPKHCGSWFYGCAALESVNGTKYLDTSAATSLKYMFAGCRKLSSVDVSGFDTSHVTSMLNMFLNCGSLVELHLGNFDTSLVTGMTGMFQNCSNLVAIYSHDFTLGSGVESQDIFKGCLKLAGGAGTTFEDNEYTTAEYAIIDGGEMDPGYFTEPPAKAVLSSDGKTLTFYYDAITHAGTSYSVVAAEKSAPSVNPSWYDDAHSCVETVVFDSSFAAYRPKHCGSWFYDFESLKTVSGLENLDTSRATSLMYMFCECGSLASLDLSGFDTAQVTDMSYMFDSCSSLRTIFASSKFVLDSVTDSEYMFDSCTMLVGGRGTVYDSSVNDATYARLDKRGQVGYFTDVDSSVAYIGKYLKLNLVEDLDLTIPADVDYSAGDKVTIKIEGLAKGLKLVATPVYVDPNAKKKVIVDYAYTLEGVPTAEVPAGAPMYARVNVTYKDKTKGTSGKSESVQCLYLVIAPANAETFPATELKADYSVSVKTIWPDVDSTWSFKGWPAGLKYTAKDVLAKDKSVLYPAFTVYGKPTKAGVFTVTASHPKLVGKTKYTETDTATLTVWGDDGKSDFAYNVTCGETAGIALSDVKSVSGLPTGLKFANGTVSGKPTKPGVYAVTVTTTSGTKYTSLWKSWEGENLGVLSSVDWKSEHYYTMTDASSVTLMQGAAYNWGVTVPTSGKVTVSGLPSGLKFAYDKGTDEWRISGTPSKVENKVAIFTTVVNGKTVVERLAFIVQANEFSGTYCLVQNDSAGASMTAIITIAPAGSSKLILTEGVRKTTVSAKAIVQTSAEGGLTYTLPANAKLGLEEREVTVNLYDNSFYLGPTDGVSTKVGTLYKAIKLPDEVTEDQVVTYASAYDSDGSGTLGYLYLSATISKKTGVVGISGKLADGTAISATSYLIYYNSGAASVAPILVKDKQGSVLAITVGVINTSFVRRDGVSAAYTSKMYCEMCAASEYKGKTVSQLTPDVDTLGVDVQDVGVSEVSPPSSYLNTKLGTGGYIKLTQKLDGKDYTFELVPVWGTGVYYGFVTIKADNTVTIGQASLYKQ